MIMPARESNDNLRGDRPARVQASPKLVSLAYTEFNDDMMFSSAIAKSAWDVFLLFVIPVGGGIPGGVILGAKRGLAWPLLMVLYFISDIALALVFEPCMRLFALAGRRFERLGKFHQFMTTLMRRTTERYGVRPSPLTLILISFGVDPMTGRAAALFAGHGFVTGWAVAIIGDMIFFTLIMTSTLWLNAWLGDGTWTVIIILAVMFLGPPAWRRLRAKFKKSKPQASLH